MERREDRMSDISSRKADHIDLCIEGDVGFRRKSNLFEEVELVHEALPELSLEEIDLRCSFAGKQLRAPLVIAAMTGGVERANPINRDLASIAEERGIGFAFGSQRPLLVRGTMQGYQVRDIAPNALVLGNIGVVQAKESSTAQLQDMVDRCGADALCVHLNPAMEVVQPEGDRDFRGGLDTIGRLVQELAVPVVAKETGCGISRTTAQKLVGLGVEWVDVSGAGGTSWVAVETHRATEKTRGAGMTFWDWGIPTAGSIAQLNGLPLGACATGGMRDGLMIAKAIALGAVCGGVARPLLQAHAEGGREAAAAAVDRLIQEIRIACLLSGARNLQQLRDRPIVAGGRLLRWVPKGSPLATRLGT
jgi:isopentenyl-diphosphate Delta-isomerase